MKITVQNLNVRVQNRNFRAKSPNVEVLNRNFAVLNVNVEVLSGNVPAFYPNVEALRGNVEAFCPEIRARNRNVPVLRRNVRPPRLKVEPPRRKVRPSSAYFVSRSSLSVTTNLPLSSGEGSATTAPFQPRPCSSVNFHLTSGLEDDAPAPRGRSVTAPRV